MNDPQAHSDSQGGTLQCAICQCPLESWETKTACPDCHTEYHLECWQENEGCATYGCPRVPPTVHRSDIEIPCSYWGRETKRCPSCGREIQAAAVRCRNCGIVFGSSRPESAREFDRRSSFEMNLPQYAKTITWIFVLSLIPCTAPLAAIYGLGWYASHTSDIKLLPAIYSALLKIGIAIGSLQTIFSVVVLLMYGTFRAP